MSDSDLDLLVEAAAVHGQLAGGTDPAIVAARTADKRLLIVAGGEAPASYHPEWTDAEDAFLRERLGFMAEAQIAAELGRSPLGVHLRWKRDLRLPAPSKDPRVLTANQVANGLRADAHVVTSWFDRGLFASRHLPTDDLTRVVERGEMLRWLLEPASWIYFDPRRVGPLEPQPRRGADAYDAEFWADARRRLDKARREWGDEWWRTPRIAAYYGISTSDVKRHIQLGRLHGIQAENRSGRHLNQYWRLWFVRRSVAIAANLGRYKRKPTIRQETTMNVTPQVRQVTDYSFTISQVDLDRYLADPQAWADDVRAQLGAAAPAMPHAVKEREAGKKTSGPKSAGKKSAGKLKCPECPATFKKQGYLERHLRLAHNTVHGRQNGSEQQPAAAAAAAAG